MRLREMLQVINDNLPALAFQPTAIAGDGAHQRVPNIEAIRLAVLRLKEVPPLKGVAETVLNHPWNTYKMEFWVADIPDVSAFISNLNNLINACGQFMNLLKVAVVPQAPNVVSISLPKAVGLADLKDLMDDLYKAIEHPVAVVLGDSTTFAGFDEGSHWVDLVFQHKESVLFVFNLVWGAVKGAKDLVGLKNELKKTTEFAKDKDETVRKAIEEVYTAREEALKDQIITEILNRTAPEKKVAPEARNVVGLAVKTVGELQERGAKIVPSLTAPKDVKEEAATLAQAPDQLPARPPPAQLPAKAHDEPSKKG